MALPLFVMVKDVYKRQPINVATPVAGDYNHYHRHYYYYREIFYE